MESQLVHTEEILDKLDDIAGRAPTTDQRRASRRKWRKRLQVKITDPGGNQRRIAVVTRNLSSKGLSFLNNSFLHIGTRCDLQLVTADNAWVDIHATVVRCRYIAGRIHEIGLRFAETVDDSRFVSTELSASILLIDDAEDVLRLTGHFLRKAGAEVVIADRGVRALKLASERAFDLVLLDVEMPGISGPVVAKTLRERGVTIPIIAYSAYDDRKTREECLAAGCSDFLAKPLGKGDLLEAVERYLAVEEPMLSKYTGNPEMVDLIHDFVISLPARIQEMQHCVRAQQAEELGGLARQLKVASSDDGGYGFGELSAAVDRLAETLTGAVDWTAVEEAMAALSNLSLRVKEEEGSRQ